MWKCNASLLKLWVRIVNNLIHSMEWVFRLLLVFCHNVGILIILTHSQVFKKCFFDIERKRLLIFIFFTNCLVFDNGTMKLIRSCPKVLVRKYPLANTAHRWSKIKLDSILTNNCGNSNTSELSECNLKYLYLSWFSVLLTGTFALQE